MSFKYGPYTRFEGSTDQNSKKKIVFRQSVRGRYVRVVPTAWQGWSLPHPKPQNLNLEP